MRVRKTPQEKAMARDLGLRLKAAREARGTTQKELAALAGVDVMQISRYERGLGMPAAETIVSLARTLKVSTDYLLLGKDVESRLEELPVQDIILLEKFKEVQRLSKTDRDALLVVIDSILVRHDEEDRVDRRRRGALSSSAAR